MPLKQRQHATLTQTTITQQLGKPCLLVGQLLLVSFLVQLLRKVQAAEQADAVQAHVRFHRCRMWRYRWTALRSERRIQSVEQQPPGDQAAITLVGTFDYIPGREIAAAAPQDQFAVAHEPVIGFGLLPIQRADTPTVQRIVLERSQTLKHALLGQVEPELEDQHAFIAEHALQTLRTADGQLQIDLADAAVNTVFQHLAVPVAEEDAGLPLGRHPSPVTPCRRMRKLLVAGYIEAVDANQARIHPFVEQLDRLALARPFDPVDQDQHRKTRLLTEPVLRVQQGLAQERHFGVVGGLVDAVADFRRLEHRFLQVFIAGRFPRGWPVSQKRAIKN